jgi:hypothetical protein
MTESICVTLHGTWLTLESDQEPFLAYAREHLAAWLSPTVEQPDIAVRLQWGETLMPARSHAANYQRLGRRLLMGDDEMLQTEILTLPGLQLRTTRSDGGLAIDATFRPPSRRMTLILKLGGKSDQERIFATLIYYLVYFPMLWHLERARGWYPLHASALAWPQGAAVFSGLGGVGKSTLTLAFLSDPSAHLLSENLILHDESRVYAFPEPIHLDEQSREMLSQLNGRLKPTGRAYSHDRESYRVPASARVQSAKPRAFFTLRQGENLKLCSLSAQETLNLVLASDALAKEINEYAQQAAVLNLLTPNEGHLQQRIAVLRKFLDKVACYELTIRPGEALRQATALVRGSLEW